MDANAHPMTAPDAPARRAEFALADVERFEAEGR
jgi:hypothetical protein